MRFLDVLADAREILASPALYDELTRRIAAEMVALERKLREAQAWARDAEDEADRAAAEVVRRGERLRAAGEAIEPTEWDGPGSSVREPPVDG